MIRLLKIFIRLGVFKVLIASFVHILLHFLFHFFIMPNSNGPPFPPPPLQPPQPPPQPLPTNAKLMLEHLQAWVDHIDKRLGKLVELLHTVNCKLNLVLNANDVEYNVSDNPSDSDDPSSGNDMED